MLVGSLHRLTRVDFAAGKSLSLDRQAVRPAPASTQGPELGLVTSRGVGPGEALVSIPESLWVTVDVVAKSDLGPALAQLPEPWVQVPSPSSGTAAGCCTRRKCFQKHVGHAANGSRSKSDS
jgi:hypothetical protein